MSSSNLPRPESSLVKARPNGMDDVPSQLLWLALQRRAWRSLAVVGASKELPTIDVANMLARLAWWYQGQPSSVADFRDLSLRLVEYQLGDVAAQLQRGRVTVIVALRSIFESPTVVPVARTVDAAVLCVQLGVTKIADSRETVDAIGRDKFLGTIIIPSPSSSPGSKNGKSK